MIPPAFIGVAMLLVLTPGAGTAFLTHAVTRHGAAATRAGIAGMFAGASTHVLAATAGLSVILRDSPALARGVAVLGGAYLLYLGAAALRTPSPARVATQVAAQVADDRPARLERIMLFRAGLITSLLNAPLALFYLIVVPQYVPASAPRTSTMLLLCAVHLAIALTWQLTYTTLVGRLIAFVNSPVVARRMQMATAITLIWFGARALLGPALD